MKTKWKCKYLQHKQTGSTHSHTTNQTSMGERKLYIFHTKSTPSTTPSQPALEYPGTLASCSRCSSCEMGPLEFCICIFPATCQIRLKAEGLSPVTPPYIQPAIQPASPADLHVNECITYFSRFAQHLNYLGIVSTFSESINSNQPMHSESSAQTLPQCHAMRSLNNRNGIKSFIFHLRTKDQRHPTPFILFHPFRFVYLFATNLFDQLVNIKIRKWNIQNASGLVPEMLETQSPFLWATTTPFGSCLPPKC